MENYNYKNYKYVMIVTSEDERYENNEKDLSWFGEHPWEGTLKEIIFGNSFDELMGNGENEGLFQQTYSMETGKRLSYGFLDLNTPREEIEEFEKENRNNEKKNWKEIVTEIAENLEWNVTINSNNFIFSKLSSAGRDFNIEIFADNLDDLKIELSDYCDDFDISYETYLWLDDSGHGTNGAPYEMIDVYKDMEECLEMSKELSYKIDQLKDESEEN